MRNFYEWTYLNRYSERLGDTTPSWHSSFTLFVGAARRHGSVIFLSHRFLIDLCTNVDTTIEAPVRVRFFAYADEAATLLLVRN